MYSQKINKSITIVFELMIAIFLLPSFMPPFISTLNIVTMKQDAVFRFRISKEKICLFKKLCKENKTNASKHLKEKVDEFITIKTQSK
jgi:hypothetical protein